MTKLLNNNFENPSSFIIDNEPTKNINEYNIEPQLRCKTVKSPTKKSKVHQKLYNLRPNQIKIKKSNVESPKNFSFAKSP